MGSWARTVGDLGVLTVGWSKGCRGLESGLEGGLEKPKGLRAYVRVS